MYEKTTSHITVISHDLLDVYTILLKILKYNFICIFKHIYSFPQVQLQLNIEIYHDNLLRHLIRLIYYIILVFFPLNTGCVSFLISQPNNFALFRINIPTLSK